MNTTISTGTTGSINLVPATGDSLGRLGESAESEVRARISVLRGKVKHWTSEADEAKREAARKRDMATQARRLIAQYEAILGAL